MKKNSDRIVITGMGVVSPNGVGLTKFEVALRKGHSGIRKIKELVDLGFRCQVAGVPPLSQEDINAFLKQYHINEVVSSGIIYGLMAATEAWKNSGIKDLQSLGTIGCIFGTGSNGAETTMEIVDILDKEMTWPNAPSRTSIQCMASAVSAYINRLFSLNGPVYTLSSACSTGTEALLEGCSYIQNGLADRMLIGSSESSGPYVWAPFDAMFATAQNRNEVPSSASAPLSENANGFVPGAGAGALILERLDRALERNADIYGEIIGGFINSGGQRGKGSMTIGSIEGMIRCIQGALRNACITGDEIDLISGHLTSTIGDVYEIQSWAEALKNSKEFPLINSTKSMIGHSLSASGSIESIASLLQINGNFVHPSLNAQPLHPDISPYLESSKVPSKPMLNMSIRTVAKVSLGFGDVNACVVFRKYEG